MEKTIRRAVKATAKTSIAGNRGFTLLELIVVLFIIGLSTSVVVFSIGRLHDKTVFNGESRRIYQTIKHAREISLMERRNIALQIDKDGNRYWIDYGDGRPDSIYSLPEKFSITGGPVLFFPKGNSSGGSITLKDGKGHGHRIEIDPVLGIPQIKRL